MIRLGEKQKLFVVRMAPQGAYLAESALEEKSSEMILLPGAQVPEGLALGDAVTVFNYKDSMDRPVATVREPRLTLGSTAKLKVISLGNIGAFLDWGLEKDLFLPFKEQTYKVKAGDEVLCALYLDKSRRLCATMKVYKYLTGAPAGRYRQGGWCEGIVYEIKKDFGAFVCVDGEYSGLIPKQELFGEVAPGDCMKLRISRIREDGRLDLSLREKSHLSIEGDVKRLLKYKEEHGGAFPFDYKTSPDIIRAELGMSKNQFKRAYGHIKYQ